MSTSEPFLCAAEMLKVASQHRLAITFDPSDMNNGPVARGWYAEKKTRSNLAVMAGRMQPLRNLMHGMKASPMVYFGLTLEGAVDNRWMQRDFTWSAGEFLAASLREPVDLQSLHRANKTVAMTGVVIERDWLDGIIAPSDRSSGQSVSTFLNSHLDLKANNASPAMWDAARRMMATMRNDSPVVALRLEAAVFDFVAAAIESISGEHAVGGSKPSSADNHRITRVRERLDTALANERLGLDDLANEFGYSVSTLCRRFRQAYGVSIGDYLADHRLQMARQALINGDMTIAQAAFQAGYSSPASFSTAFKRTFGISPGRVQ